MSNWLPFFAMTITLVFNILGEEFWWRGVVLPRQELAFGNMMPRVMDMLEEASVQTPCAQVILDHLEEAQTEE